MQCVEFLEYSPRWMEGERDAVAAVHLKSCTGCSALVADLEAISGSARQLSEVEPPARVWVSLRNHLEVEGLIHEPAAAALPAPPRPRLFFGLRPALASSLAALLVVVGGFAAYQVAFQGDRFVAQEKNPVVAVKSGSDGSEVMTELAAFASLASAKAPEMHEHNPVVTAAYRQNLQVVDNAIAMCEKTMKEQPKNETAREFLVSAYQQKADLLASMNQRGASGD